MSDRLRLLFLIDAVAGTSTEAMIVPVLGAISDFNADADYLIEELVLLSTEVWASGTATLYTRKNGTQGATAHAQLSTSQHWQDEARPDPNDAEHQLAAGDRLGLDLVTASWTPATADMIVLASLSKLT